MLAFSERGMRMPADIEGRIIFRLFAEGSKSESMQPYLVLPDGSEVRVTFSGDNPFENTSLEDDDGRTVIVSGDYSPQDPSLFEITAIREPVASEEGDDASVPSADGDEGEVI